MGIGLTSSVGEGIIEEVTLSTVKIRKFSKAIQTVPNGVIAAEPIINWSRAPNRRIKMDIGLVSVSYTHLTLPTNREV